MSAGASGRAAVSDFGANLRSLLWIALGILLVAVAVVAVIIGATHHSVDRQRGTAALAEAQQQLDNARNALANRRAVEARQAYAAVIAALTREPTLGGAVSPPSPGDKQAVPELAQRAALLKAEAATLVEPIAQVEAATAVDVNLAVLRARLARLGDPATDLDVLERDLLAYCANPVDPKAMADSVVAAVYPQQVGEVQLRLPEIPAERNRRRIERVTVPVDRLRPQIQELIQQEHFGEALAKIDAAKSQAAEADFTVLREQVDNAAANAWRSAKTYAETRLADWKSPGATAEQRAKAVADAKRRLNRVIDIYGLPDYAQQAKAMQDGLP